MQTWTDNSIEQFVLFIIARVPTEFRQHAACRKTAAKSPLYRRLIAALLPFGVNPNYIKAQQSGLFLNNCRSLQIPVCR
jgi:hypothetical protein